MYRKWHLKFAKIKSFHVLCRSQLHIRPYFIGYIGKDDILDHMYHTELDNTLIFKVYVEIAILS